MEPELEILDDAGFVESGVVNRPHGDLRPLRRREIFAPPAHLAPWLRSAWIEESPRPGARDRTVRVVPDTSAHIIAVVHRTAAGSPRLRVRCVGPRSIYVDVHAARRIRTVGVRFRPGGFSAWCGVDVSELTDRGCHLDDLLGAPARAWRRRLDSWSGPALLRRLYELITELPSRPIDARPIDGRMRELERALRSRTRTPTVEELAARLDLSSRRLRDLTRTAIGLGPKRCIQIERAHRTIELAILASGTTAPASWATLAHRMGYADQSHLVHQFRALLGEPPRRFLARRAPPDRAGLANRDATGPRATD